jgi:putative DNA primase/helicase
MNVLRPRYDSIPTELKARNQWVCWLLKKVEQTNGKPPKKPFTKIPICPMTGTNASTTEPTTWADFDKACTFYQDFADDGGSHGLGFILRDDLIGVDLDGCRDTGTGEIAEWATKIINLLGSYTEISPSGTGIRIFCKGEPQPKGSNRRKGEIEIYDCNSPRYLTVTGWHLDGTPTTIEPRQAELEKLYGQVFHQDEKKQELAVECVPIEAKAR